MLEAHPPSAVVKNKSSSRVASAYCVLLDIPACRVWILIGCFCLFTTSRVTGHAYIMSPPDNVTSEEGSRVSLRCEAEGYPNNITYQWYKDDVDVNQLNELLSRAWIYAGAL